MPERAMLAVSTDNARVIGRSWKLKRLCIRAHFVKGPVPPQKDLSPVNSDQLQRVAYVFKSCAIGLQPVFAPGVLEARVIFDCLDD